MTHIKNLHKRVLGILQNSPEARNSDAELQCQILTKFYGINPKTASYEDVVKNKDIPSIESTGRARRKCQELYPWLKADDDVEAGRMIMEGEFREYGKGIY